jgi:tight adherence protein B
VHPLLIAIAVLLAVGCFAAAIVTYLRNDPSSKMEDRLDVLTGTNTPAAAKEGLLRPASVLAEPIDKLPGIIERFLERFGNLELLFEQADTSLTVMRLVTISAVLAVAGVGLGTTLGIHPALMPAVGLFMGAVPLMWVLFRRRRRMRIFATQLPDALEMLARALRSGQSLALGFNLIANEMSAPIAKEFGRVFEEQNLGIPLEESLDGLTDRIPNLDLKFFATAVVLQKQTGGDLAEILDKIGSLIRERFQIWGQVQALTGEGRLSGIVLLALPFVLFVAIYQLNPGYVSNLFTDPLGKQMLAAAVVMQVLGALVIRKIVNIKV